MKLKVEFVIRDLPGTDSIVRREMQRRVWEAISNKYITINIDGAGEYILSPNDYSEMVED